MQLKTINGLENAGAVLDRADPLDLSSLPATVLERTKELFGPGVGPEQSVIAMLKDVRTKGDAAVRRYAKLLDGAELDQLQVAPDEMDRALEGISRELRDALETAADRVRNFHQAVLPRSWVDLEKGLGEMVRPLERVGLYAPGGSAAYPIHRTDDRHSGPGRRGRPSGYGHAAPGKRTP